ncbi:MAG: hypothetical protein AAF432_00930 [Planctomycetota bacterium]
MRNLLSVLMLLFALGCEASPEQAESDGVRTYDMSYLDELLSSDFDWDSGSSSSDNVLQQDWLASYAAGSSARVVPVQDRVAYAEVRTGWTVLLKTFTNENHEAAAHTMRTTVTQIAPQLGEAYVQTTGESSLVAFGFFDEPTDEDAQAGLAAVKDTEFRGQKLFPLAMLSPIKIGEEGDLHPYDLRVVRQTYPRIRDLYTLDIAVWGGFDSDEWPRERVRQTAESFALQLRAKGEDAYFFHNDASGLSSVSVGVFDSRAYDAQSQMLSSEVRAVMKKFPYRLTNGEPLFMLEDPQNPEASRKIPQPSMLSVIPESES